MLPWACTRMRFEAQRRLAILVRSEPAGSCGTCIWCCMLCRLVNKTGEMRILCRPPDTKGWTTQCKDCADRLLAEISWPASHPSGLLHSDPGGWRVFGDLRQVWPPTHPSTHPTTPRRGMGVGAKVLPSHPIPQEETSRAMKIRQISCPTGSGPGTLKPLPNVQATQSSTVS